MIEIVADLSTIAAYRKGKYVFPVAGLEIDTARLGRESVNAEYKSADSKVGFLNVTSLKRHIERVKKFLTRDPSYHILGVAETRLGPTVDDNLFNIPVYSIIRQVRNTGGGVALYLRDTLKVQILTKSETSKPGNQKFLNIWCVKYGRVTDHLFWCFLCIDRQTLHLLPKNIPKKLQAKQCPLTLSPLTLSQ